MVACAETFIALLDSREIRYQTADLKDGGIRVVIPYDGKMTSFFFSGDDDGQHVALRTLFDSCPEDRIADVLVVCNALNNQYRWLKFCIDDDNDIMVEDDAILEPATAGEECFELLSRTANILSEVKPTLMRAIYA